MIRYKNISGKSGVIQYQAGSDYILVKFINDAIYRYTYASAGKQVIEKMKQLAKQGKGLSTYISQFVKDNFENA